MQKNNLEYLISLFLGLYLFGFFIEGFTKIKYIGLYGSFILFIPYAYINFYNIKQEFFSISRNNKILIVAFFAFIFSIIISIIFSYGNNRVSISEFRVEFLNIMIFAIISSSMPNKKKLLKIFFIYTLAAFAYEIIDQAYLYFYNNQNLNLSLRFNRNFTNYLELLMPFAYLSILFLKGKIRNILLFIFLISVVELFLSGARGAWISIFFTLFCIALLLYVYIQEYRKKVLYSFIIFMVTLITLGYYFYNNSTLIKYKISQSVSPNGRDKIVKTRLPIFLKHGNIFIGIGGPGGYQYQKFLNDFNAPKIYGEKNGKTFKYWGDEPFLLQIFYKEGILGLLLFLLYSFIFLFENFKKLKTENNLNRLIAIYLFSTYFGYYFTRGLVEGRSLKIAILFLAIFLIYRTKKTE